MFGVGLAIEHGPDDFDETADGAMDDAGDAGVFGADDGGFGELAASVEPGEEVGFGFAEFGGEGEGLAEEGFTVGLGDDAEAVDDGSSAGGVELVLDALVFGAKAGDLGGEIVGGGVGEVEVGEWGERYVSRWLGDLCLAWYASTSRSH